MDDSEQSVATEQGALQIHVTSFPSGAAIGIFTLPSTATVANLKRSIADAGGPPRIEQRIVHEVTTLNDESQPLKDLQEEASSDLSFGVVRVNRRNLALASTGARMVGEWGEWQNRESKPLLRFDDAFPDLEGDPSGTRLGEVVSGADLAEHLKTKGWSGDCAQSTFLPEEGEVIVHIPGELNHFEKVGFTYSPWDRNYGSKCSVQLSCSGPSGPWDVVGEIQVPRSNSDRGDPRHNSAQTLYLEVPHEYADASYNHVKLSFGHRGHGRRLYFLYAFGY